MLCTVSKCRSRKLHTFYFKTRQIVDMFFVFCKSRAYWWSHSSGMIFKECWTERHRIATFLKNDSNVLVESCNWPHLIYVVFHKEKVGLVTVWWKTADGNFIFGGSLPRVHGSSVSRESLPHYNVSQRGVRQYPVVMVCRWVNGFVHDPLPPQRHIFQTEADDV